MQIFAENVRRLWNEWELRALVLISLALQIILMLVGNWRKSSASVKIRFVLWLAYLSADAIATFSLGVLSNKQGESGSDSINSSPVLMALWAPFLLLHLGGPDTITAYSLEDNELWLRHLVCLIVQVGGAVYICFRSWARSALNYLAILVFVSGISKYGERTWVLRSASSQYFRESMLPNPDQGPNYARYMEEYSSKKDEGFKVDLESDPTTVVELDPAITGSGDPPHPDPAVETNANNDHDIQDSELLEKAHVFFLTFKRLCADLILSFHDIMTSQSFFQSISEDQAFKVIEFELGFMYDLFYTKSVLVHSLVGGCLRFISFLAMVSASLTFLLIDKQGYSRVDIIVSLLLFFGAIFLEILAVILMLLSDWTVLRLYKQHKRNAMVGCLYKLISISGWDKRKRWSKTMAQHNLIRLCLENRQPKCFVIQKLLFIDQFLEKHRHLELEEVSSHLKRLIVDHIKQKSKQAKDSETCKKLCGQRGDEVLQKEKCFEKLRWSINEAEFDKSILIWHIATDLCLSSDREENQNSDEDPNCEASKLLSNYMLYLLVICPFMLPNGIGQIRFRDTCAEAEEFFKERKSITDAAKACNMLMKVSTEVHPSKVKGDRSKSVLFEACILAKSLKSVERRERGGGKKKWEVVSQVWVEMLAYAANHCSWSQHAQQLRRGGELCTHVWLLMAHFGITEQFQISTGHARAKLIVE